MNRTVLEIKYKAGMVSQQDYETCIKAIDCIEQRDYDELLDRLTIGQLELMQVTD